MSLKLARDVVPISEFKANASNLITEVRTLGRSIVITQNGEPAAVVIPPEEYDLLQEERARFLQKIDEGLADAAAGRVIEDAELERRLKKRLKAKKSGRG